MADKVIGFTRVKRIGSVLVDCFVSETINFGQELTSHVTDDQAPITDHLIKRPIEFSVEGILSETPLIGAIRESVKNFYKKDLDNNFVGPVQPGDEEERGRLSIARQKIRTLIGYYTTGEEINIETGLFKLEKYVMTTLSIPRNIQMGRNVNFSATFEKPRRASISITEREFSNAQVERVQPKKDVGTKDVTKVNDEQAKAMKKLKYTTGSDIFDFFTDVGAGL